MKTTLLAKALIISLVHLAALNSVLNWSVDPLTLSVNNSVKR